MPPLTTSDLKETAVLWPVEGKDHRGTLLRGEPVEVKVRWDWRREDVLDANGQKVAIDARAGVDREVKVDSWMWLGKLDDWYASGSSPPDNNLCQVRVSSSAKDDKGRRMRFSVGLVRFTDSLPDLAP